MTKLLVKLFVKNPDKTSDPIVRKAYGTLSSIVGIIINFLLASIKLFAGILSGSIAITADAFNNLSDAGSSVVTLISFKLSAKPADRDHPFGHARMEYVSSMIVSFLIMLVGFELLMDSVGSIFTANSDSPSDLSLLTIIILSISILMKLWLGVFNNKNAKAIGSEALRAASTDSFSDTISTTAVLASNVLVSLTGYTIIDAIVGLAVSVIILIAGAKILNETKNALLGEAPVKDIVDNIEKIVSEYPDIIGIHDMMVHNYGPRTYIASFHAEVDGEDDIFRLHDTIDNVERSIKDRLGIACTIHMDPIVTNDEKTNELRTLLDRSLEKIETKLSIHDFRVVIGDTHTNLIFDVVVPFECKENDATLVRSICDSVAEEDPKCYCVITVDRG